MVFFDRLSKHLKCPFHLCCFQQNGDVSKELQLSCCRTLYDCKYPYYEAKCAKKQKFPL